MLHIRTILCPTDFSPQADYAFRVACALARDYGAKVILVHAWYPTLSVATDLPVREEDVAACREGLQEQMAKLKPAGSTVPVERLLREGGGAVEVILATEKSRRCDVIVMGTHGRRGLGRLLLGSVAEAVLRQAPCPVLTVRAPEPAAPEPAEAPEAAHA